MTGITDRYGVHAHIKKATSMRKLLKSAKGAIDLPSIMIGVVVIGILSGIVGATVFVAIPWSQDKAASNSLSSISAAQESYRKAYDQYTTYDKLVEKGLMKKNPNYCSTTNGTGKTYDSASKSSTGKVYVNNAAQLKPREAYANELTCLGKYTPPTAPTAPAATTAPVTAPTTAPTTAPVNNIVEFTVQCPVGSSAVLPLQGVKGTIEWKRLGVSDGSSSYVGTNYGTKFPSKTVQGGGSGGGIVYTAKFTGTFTHLTTDLLTADEKNCIRSMDSWGEQTGTISASSGFKDATNLTSVPNALPSTVTNLSYVFSGAASFNSPNVSTWNTVNVTEMNQAFREATVFNQPLNSWNTAKVTNMSYMFYMTPAFNQPLDSWNTTNNRSLIYTFFRSGFNQPLSTWDTSNVTTMIGTFQQATAFNQNIDTWNTAKVTNMDSLFSGAISFNQPVNSWNTIAVTSMQRTFGDGIFNQPLSNWNTTNVTNMSQMFYLNSKFNQNISTWNTGNVTTMYSMFAGNPVFNQPLNTWNVSKVADFSEMFFGTQIPGGAYTAFNQPLNNWNTASATNMTRMFADDKAFNQNISGWTISSSFPAAGKTNFSGGSPLTAANSPRFP
jgi:surface protein